MVTATKTRKTNGYAEINGGDLYYEIAGEGDTIVLIHAAFIDSGQWDPQFDEFAQQYRVIRFDNRGNGRSAKPAGAVSRRDDMYKLLQHLGVERAAIVGSSMSGEAALDLAIEHPDFVSALVLVGAIPSGFQVVGEPPRYMQEMAQTLQGGDTKAASELQIRIWLDGEYREPTEVDPSIRRRASAMNKKVVENKTYLIADASPLKPLNPPAMECLKSLKVPALVVVGDLDSPEIRRASDIMADGIPGAKQVTITGAGHVPNMEKPQEFNQAVLSFLRGIH